MDLGLAGKIAFITGASRGIGASTARLFAEEGADVLIGYHRDRRAAEQTAEQVRRASRQAWLVELDVSDPVSVASATAEIKRLVAAIDVAVLCAGTNAIRPLLQTTPAEWDEVLRVNLSGTFYVLREMAPILREFGAVVTVASVAGHTGAPHHAHYAAAKAGVINLTKSAAKSLAPRIRVNCVAPGLTETEMGKQAIGEQDEGYLKRKLLAERMASPEEIARTIVFLSSPAASFIYGATLDVNGGRDLR